MRLDFKASGKYLVKLQVRDDDAADSENNLRVYTTGGTLVSEFNFGIKQNINGLTNLNINYTLLSFTQFKIDIGAPVHYSVTTSYVDSTSLNSLYIIAIVANGITINVIDTDCP